MSESSRMTLVGFVLLIAGGLTGAAWLGTSGVLANEHGWWLAATFGLMVSGTGFLVYLRPRTDSKASEKEELALAERKAAALESCHNQLEHLSTHLETLGSLLARRGEPATEIVPVLARCASHLERLSDRVDESRIVQQVEATASESEHETLEGNPVTDLAAELQLAWSRYRRDGDGYFNASGLQVELVNRGIDAKVEVLRQEGHGFLLVDDTSTKDRHFFVVPDFTKSPRSAARWFEDQSSKRLGGKLKELKRLARGRWSGNHPRVVEKGVVA